MRRMALLCILGFFVSAGGAVGQVSIGETGTLQGTVFGDFYWIPFNHNSDLEGNNGFWFRRIYLTYDREIGESFSSRLRLEMNSEGDFITDSKMIPVVKDAYLKWNDDRHAIYAGISPTPTWGLVEEVWGYRSVEQTPLDLQNMGSSRDFGISLKGSINAEKTLNYHFMVGNGNSNRTEIDRGKKVMLSLNYALTEHLVIEAYGDYNRRPDNWSTTFQGFLGYRGERLNAGALYSLQIINGEGVSDKRYLDVVSLFTHFRLAERTRGILRIDHTFDMIPGTGNNDYIPISDMAESTLILGGVDLPLHDKIHLMPNVEALVYGQSETGIRPDPDLIAKLTLAYVF